MFSKPILPPLPQVQLLVVPSPVFYFGTAHGCSILVPQPGIELLPPAVETQSLNHKTTREVPSHSFLEKMIEVELIYNVNFCCTPSDSVMLLLLLSRFSCVRLLATPWTAAHQGPPSMGFSRREYWSGVPLPSPDSVIHICKNSSYSFPSCFITY